MRPDKTVIEPCVMVSFLLCCFLLSTIKLSLTGCGEWGHSLTLLSKGSNPRLLLDWALRDIQTTEHKKICIKDYISVYIILIILWIPAHWHNGQCVCQWCGRKRFNPWSNHIKDSKKWYWMPPGLTFTIIRYGSRVMWSNPAKGVASSSTIWCSSY